MGLLSRMLVVRGDITRLDVTGEAALLRSAYTRSLRLAQEAGVVSVAFPCISTGAYGYPKAEACDIAVAVVEDWLRTSELPATVIFCCFSQENYDLYRTRLGGDA